MLNPEFISVWFRIVAGTALSVKPLTLAELPVAVQVNKVPVTFDVNVRLVDVLLQSCSFAGVFDKLGPG